MYWSLQLLGHGFQKARNFTASSHQNAGFSIWVFKNFPGIIPPNPHSGRGRPPPAPNTQPGFWQAPRCWDPNLGPLNFSAVVAPLVQESTQNAFLTQHIPPASFLRISSHIDDVINHSVSRVQFKPERHVIAFCA